MSAHVRRWGAALAATAAALVMAFAVLVPIPPHAEAAQPVATQRVHLTPP